MAFDYKARLRNTRFARLVVKGVPKGATVTATCPRGCARKRLVKRNASGNVSLSALVTKPVAVGRVITVVVARPGEVAAVKRLKIRSRKGPLVTTRCLPPGEKKIQAC